jgi:trimeric autotransporter adhesin
MAKKIVGFCSGSLLVFSVFLLVPLVYSQEQVSIGGKVTDARGVPVPGATVRISTPEEKEPLEKLTDLDGTFVFEVLSKRTYQLTIEIVGFLKSTKESVDPTTEESRNLSIRLDSLPRPPRPAIQKQAAKQQAQIAETQTFQTAEVTDLPGLNQFQQTAAQTDNDAASLASKSESVLLISGNNATLDGGNLNNPQFRQEIMDAARQMGFQIQEFNPGGAGGRGGPGEMSAGSGGPGGGSGGGPMGGGPGGGGMSFGGIGGRGGRGATFKQPLIEGNANETYSNSALNARSYSLTGNELPKPVLIQNNFGITLGGVLPFFKSTTSSSRANTGQRGMMMGGPVSRPGWSFSYSGSRNRSAQDILTTVPTDLERQGDFSQTYVRPSELVQLYLNPNDPSSRFTKIDMNPDSSSAVKVDRATKQLLDQFIPRENLYCSAVAKVPCVNNYAIQRSLINTSDQFQGGVTGLRLTSRDNIGVTYSMSRGSSVNAAIFPNLDTTRETSGQNAGISGTHMFKNRLVANWRITLNRTRTESTNAYAYTQNIAKDLGIDQQVSQDPINWGPPAIGFTNYGSISLATPVYNRNQTFTISGGLNKIGSKHSIRTGGDVNWAQRNSRNDTNGRGTYNFSSGNLVTGTGYDLADFLLGRPYSTSRSFMDRQYGNSLYLRNRTWNLYVMDNWQLRSNLTLNYGLRYEYVGPTYEKYNRLASLDVSPGFTDEDRVLPNSEGPLSGQYFPRSIVNPDRNNFAPRIGIAWRPTRRSRVVIRAGYGIGYNTGGYSSIVSRLMNQAPFAITQNFSSDRSNLTFANGFPATFDPNNPGSTLANTYAIDPNYRSAYAQQWNLDIQTQLSRLYSLTVTYSGVKGTGLDLMLAPPAHKNDGYLYMTSSAGSIYHGLNLQINRRFSHGFNMMSSYTLSKSRDNSTGSGSSVAQNYANPAAEWSVSSQDQRHSFQTNFTYELPFGQNRMFLAAASQKVLNFVSGWTISGSFSLSSGSPVTARYASGSGSNSGAALYNALRADATGAEVSIPRGERTVKKFFNTDAFAVPSGTYGSAERNTITGPGNNVVNLSIRKGFRLDDNNRRVDLSWQVQNLFNHPNWSSLGTTVNANNFGQVTGVRAMRSMSMNLRIRF